MTATVRLTLLVLIGENEGGKFCSRCMVQRQRLVSASF